MKKHLLALAAAALVAGCGSNDNGAGDGTSPTPTPTPAATTGAISAQWAFAGAEAPSLADLKLIDAGAAGITCATLPYAPSAGVLGDKANLPVDGTAQFVSLAPGNGYLLALVGTKADGTKVAQACAEGVHVVAGQTTDVSLDFANWVGNTIGVWQVDQHLNIGLPTQIQTALQALQAACGILGNSQLCTIVTQVNDVVTNLDVKAEWTIDRKNDGTFDGSVRWLSVQGLDVTDINLVTGGFTANVPGSTVMQFQSFDETIQFGNLVLFIVQDVLGYDLGAFGTPGAILVQALADHYVSPMTFTGGATLADPNHDGINDKLSGQLAGHLQVSGWGHDFDENFSGVK